MALAQALKAATRLGQERGKLRNRLDQRHPERAGLGSSDELLGRPVENGNASVEIDADDAGARTGEDGLGEPAPAIDHIVRAHQVIALGPQLLRHFVEGLPKLGKIALLAAHRHPHVEIAGGNLIGGADQTADRRDQAFGEI